MSSLLEFREKIKQIYSKSEVFLLPLMKFLLAFVTFDMVNRQLGYMKRLDNMALLLIAALMCSFLPNGCIILLAAVFSLMHMYALSMEVALVGLCVYVLMFLIYFRFSTKDSLIVILTPLLFVFKIPYVMPIAAGLLAGPSAAISLGCGVLIYYFMNSVSVNATTISTMGDEEVIAKLRLVIDALLNNKTMMVVIAAFAITALAVYLLRKLSVDYAWTIAMVAGAILNLVILLVGDLMYDTNMSVGSAILGTAIALAVAKVIEFFRFCVDYSRTEKVQFEDDEYYYYVKAVPKMTVAAPTKTVKKINSTQRKPAPSGTRMDGESTKSRTRSVVTERSTQNGTGTGRSSQSDAQRYRREHNSGGKSITINSNGIDSEESEDYEEFE
ncbi:hypothetical protein LJC58_02495 [Lachnospiraceae bacterium OttesenSCG-928-D06]|nr:hypothetical protein [Lachnospiraceae bacterium OttesenSCG-928-D06]